MTIDQFIQAWTSEAKLTHQVMQKLTDETISQKVVDDHRTLGRIAWHIVTTIPEMMEHTGLKLDLLKTDAPVPATALDIERAYVSLAAVLLEKIKQEWTNESLDIKDDMYGETWERRFTLTALIQHQVHHRGQMTVLMRQAGLRVPSIYGPAREDWAEYDMEEPAV
ncbi:MAG: DinB family protein [bacterium]